MNCENNIKTDCFKLVFRMLFVLSMFIIATVIAKTQDMNQERSIVWMSIFIVIAMLIPTVSLIKVALTVKDLIIAIIVERQDWIYSWMYILVTRYGWSVEQTWSERHLSCVPIIGKKIQKNYQYRRYVLAKAIFFRCVTSIIIAIVCYFLAEKIIRAELIKYVTGKSTVEILIYYVKRAWNIING